MNEVVYSNFRWYVMFTLVICTATTAMGLIGPAPLIPAMLETMPQYSAGQLTLITMSSFNLFVALSALFGGFLLDRLGVIRVFIGGLVLVSAGALLMPLIGNSFWGMVFNRMLQGCGTGPIMAAAAPIAAAYFPHKERSIVTGFQGFSVAFGVVLGLMIVPRMAAAFSSWQKALMVIGPIGIVGVVLALIIVFGPKPHPAEAAEDAAEGPQPGLAHAFRQALSMPVTWIAIACYFIMSWIFQGFNDVVPGYVGVEASSGLGSLGLGMVKGGDYLVLAQVFFMGGSVLGGVITDKVFGGNGRPVMATGFLLGALFSWLIMADFVTTNEALLIFCLTGCGFFFSFVNPQAVGYIAKNYPREITGKLAGLATGIAIFGGWGGATVGGILIHLSGYPASIHINVMGFCLAGFVIALFLKPRSVARQGD